ncbi:MAG: phosphate ABC transporter permease subunit PstC [Gammaproteobacteria bacterium]
MEALSWLLLLAAFAAGAAAVNRPPALPSPPAFYGGYAALAAFCGGGAIWAAFAVFALPPEAGAAAGLIPAIAAALHCRRLQRARKRARAGFEHLALWMLAAAALVATLTTAGIVFAVAAEAVRFFQLVPVSEFLFGAEWSPQIAIREDQAGASGAFGIAPVLTGTLLITAVAMAVATPMGFVIAVYLSEFAAPQTRARVKPALEILAGVPTIVYGFFAVAVLSPLLRDLGAELGANIAGESALAAGLVMGMMLVPFIASLSEDALFAAPDSLRQGALALGSTRYEAALYVAVPAALPGIAAGILLAFSRAVGETMIVVMAAGIAARMTLNPLEAVTTVTVQIVTLLTGDQEFDDPKTLAAFALGLSLFCITLALNLLAQRIVRRYRLRYE